MRLSAICQGGLALIFVLVLAGSARADLTLVVSSHERTLLLTQALELELRGHGMLTAFRAMGDARSPLERAAFAQRVARRASARVALWIEPGPPARVRAVGSGEHEERIIEAPLPAALDTLDARAFAQIAASVVLELLGAAPLGLPPAATAELIVPMPPWSCTGDWAGRPFGAAGKRALPTRRWNHRPREERP